MLSPAVTVEAGKRKLWGKGNFCFGLADSTMKAVKDTIQDTNNANIYKVLDMQPVYDYRYIHFRGAPKHISQRTARGEVKLLRNPMKRLPPITSHAHALCMI
ncbi:hypothetical protein RhiLY_12421 [Ceratobasidium sp. AG-Ba]|nr:hypothetical protein RhiLY_12421 [Ceratobasidium sp. AG-Ba]